jgi:hypothetical protein
MFLIKAPSGEWVDADKEDVRQTLYNQMMDNQKREIRGGEVIDRENMDKWEIIQAAMEFEPETEVDTDSVHVETRIKTDENGLPDGHIFRVELNADTVVWVHENGFCERHWGK